MLEIERKFLISQIPNLSDYSYAEIEQGYLSFAPEIRIRRKGEKCYITSKGEGTKTRPETETEIDNTAYSILSNLIQGRLIKKSRYLIPLNTGLVAELDLYHDDLEGLIVVEVEFDSEQQAQDFISPTWFGEDITEDKRYKNKNLARIEEVDLLLNQSKQYRIFKKTNKKG